MRVYLFELISVEFCACKTINVSKCLDKTNQGHLTAFNYSIVTPSLGGVKTQTVNASVCKIIQYLCFLCFFYNLVQLADVEDRILD